MAATIKDDGYWMGKALREAAKAAACGEVPIGAVVVRDGELLGRGFNERERKKDPTAHAEVIALRRAAAKSDSWRLAGADLYVTLEPCLMCMGAIVLARIRRVVFGCYDPKGGAAGSLYNVAQDGRLNHQVELVPLVRAVECSQKLSEFFAGLRKKKAAQ